MAVPEIVPGGTAVAGTPLPRGTLELAANANDSTAVLQARAELTALQGRLDTATKRYNGGVQALRVARVELARTQIAAMGKRVEVDRAQSVLNEYVADVYTTGSGGNVGYLQLLGGEEPQELLHIAGALQVMGEQQGDALVALQRKKRELVALEAAAVQAEREQALEAARLADERSSILSSYTEQARLVKAIEADTGFAILAEGPEIPPVVISSASQLLASAPLPVRPLSQRREPEVIVTGALTPAMIRQLQALTPSSTVALAGRVRTASGPALVLGVDPGTFRVFAPEGAAENEKLWQVVARDELALRHAYAVRAKLQLGQVLRLTSSEAGASGKPGAAPAAKPSSKPSSKPAAKPSSKPASTPGPKPSVKPSSKPAPAPGSSQAATPLPRPTSTAMPAPPTPPDARLGALATMKIPGDIITSRGRARQLGFTHHSVILSGGGRSAFEVERAARRIVGKGGRVENLLAPPPGPPGVLGSPSSVAPRAFLSGSSAAAAFGSFSYRYFADGTIAPDPAWVAANIRTETMPIVGSVTGHRLMLPQLRGALTEIEAAGLGGFFMTYDGCYVPRFIARDPSRGISLHTWGIAIDLNASTNYRGIKGDMDPRVVTIFKRWGFRWGGDWRYTDPMHFELGSVQR